MRLEVYIANVTRKTCPHALLHKCLHRSRLSPAMWVPQQVRAPCATLGRRSRDFSKVRAASCNISHAHPPGTHWLQDGIAPPPD